MSRQQERKSQMETLFVVLSLNVRSGSSEEIWPLRGFFTVSLSHADLHPDKILLFLKYKNVRSVSKIWGPNDRKKVAEINALLN